MKWIKASERLPKIESSGFFKVPHYNINKYGYFDGKSFHYGEGTYGKKHYDMIWWLEEDESDGSDREMEEFAEWIDRSDYVLNHDNRMWYIIGDRARPEEAHETLYITTSELLKLFRQSKTDKPNPQP